MAMSVAINLSSVGKTFYRQRGGAAFAALENVNLEIEEGEFFCLLGPSGCGKSTLLHMIAGFEMPTRGDLRVFGERVRGPGVDRGVIFQSELALFSWLTVEENIAYGLRARGIPRKQREASVERYVDLVGLRGHRKSYPREISGGMKQRVQIARILANDPAILLMDEPFGALDAQTRAQMQRYIAELWANLHKTIIFVTHDVAEAVWLADRIGVMTVGPRATVKTIVNNDIARPRAAMTAEFVRIYNELTAELEGAFGVGQGSPQMARQ